MQIITDLILDVTRRMPVRQYLVIPHGDNGVRMLRIWLTNMGNSIEIPEDVLPVLCVKKPDDTKTMTPGRQENGALLFELKAQTLSCVGDATCDVQLISGVDVLTSVPFELRVVAPVIGNKDIVSSSEYSVFAMALLEAQEALSSAQKVLATIQNDDGGAAIGQKAYVDAGGGSVGYRAFAESGGAIGQGAYARTGGAIGTKSRASTGGGIGDHVYAGRGGAVGEGAVTGSGFAGGCEAKTAKVGDDGKVLTDYKGRPQTIDAIQLGVGTNSKGKTLQVYDYQLMDANGWIPAARLRNAGGGFVAGWNASATGGGAIGYGAYATTGFAGGRDAEATSGGAVGRDASTESGGAVGKEAHATYGGAVGLAASTSVGGAVGHGAESAAGFAGGYKAKTKNGDTYIDAIQLGTGTNSTLKTLQVYEYQLMDANGNIPIERLAAVMEYITALEERIAALEAKNE